jgi:nucleotidyltransferase/DNA polymerase involved in DNA repair
MARAVIVAAESFDLLIRIGIATNKLAARIASRQPSSPTVISAGEESRFLAPLPLRELELEPRLAATLFRWGITTIGDLARLPADRVASRLGRTGLEAHKSACGIDSSPLETHQPPPTIAEGLELEWPVVTVEPLLYAIGQSLDRIRRRLERQDLASTSLDLELALEPSGSDRRTIRLPAPTRDVEALLALIRLELEARPPRSPVAAFACAVRPDRPRRGQLTLFGSPDIHPDKLAATLARLHARLGPDRVGSPCMVNAHLPERFENASFDPPPAPKLRRSPGNGRGLLVVRVIRPPVALEVITEEQNSKLQIANCKLPPTHPSSDCGLRIEDCGFSATEPGTVREGGGIRNPKSEIRNPTEDPTCNLQPEIEHRLISVASVTGATPRIQGLVRVAAGPWALEEGWWRGEPVARAYWDVELSGGGLYRIYQDRRTGDWFADGMYD